MFKSFKNFMSKYAVTVSITVVGTLIAHNAIVAYISQNAINERNQVEEDLMEVNNLLDTHTTMVNLLDLGLRGYFMMEKEGFIDPYNIATEQYEDNLDQLVQVMEKLDYPKVDSIEFVKKKVTEYANLVGQGIDYIKAGEKGKAIELFASDPGFDLWNTYNPIFQNVQGYASDLNMKSRDKYEFITSYALVSQTITVIIGVPVLLIVLIRLIRQENRIIGLFDSLKESKQKYIFKERIKNTNENVLQKGAIINDMIANLRKASGFIKGISQGDLSAKWDGMTEELKKENKGTIAGELIEMRDQLKKVQEEDRQRQWITEGVAKFSDLIREYKDDFDELSNQVISFIVNYTDSNQGGLYLLNEKDEDDPFIELVSCYAYSKQKYVNKRIEIGSGMLGQVFLEGETAIFKDLPEDYIKITSGIGESLPRNIIIVPIIMDDKTQGILELASFEEYSNRHIELLERISLTLASEIVTSKSSKIMKELFEKSQENEEMMKSQEEEMRQNMEELQATQEEQERQRKELQEKIEQLESELAAQNNETS